MTISLSSRQFLQVVASRRSPRREIAKGTDLSGISQTELNDVARLMNQRPRKTLGWKTPEEAMAEELAALRSNVALAT